MTTEYDPEGVIQTGRMAGSHTRPNSAGRGQREIVWHRPVPPTITEGRGFDGAATETHDAYGVVIVNRRSISTPGVSLFESDIKHQETVVLRVERASRERSLHRDWIHGDGKAVVEIEMSLAQWASAVSSFGLGGGVPVTIRSTETNANVDGVEFQPRLAITMEATKRAAAAAFGDIQAAMAAVDALDAKAPAAEKREAMKRLRLAIEHSTGKVDFASKRLIEQTEDITQKARADVEAFVLQAQHAVERGIESGTAPAFEIEA